MLLKIFVLVEVFVSCQGQNFTDQECLNIEECPYMVSIQRAIRNTSDNSKTLPKISYHWCSGIIIRNDVVLTSANCTSSLSNKGSTIIHVPFLPQDLLVVAGATMLWKSCGYQNLYRFQRLGVRKNIVYFTYSPATVHSGIALLWLSSSFLINQRTQIVTFAPSDTSGYKEPWDIYKKEECFAIGWGRVLTSIGLSLCLHPVNVFLFNKTSCDTLMKKFENRTMKNNELCGVSLSKDFCRGDTSGPLICENHLIGYAVREYCNGIPIGVWSKVNEYRNWINFTLDKFKRTGDIRSTGLKTQPCKLWIVVLAMVSFLTREWARICGNAVARFCHFRT